MLVTNCFSIEHGLRRLVNEAQAYSYLHNDVVTMYAELAEHAGREELFPMLQEKYDTLFENIQIVSAGRKHLRAIERLHKWDGAPN